MTARKRRWAGLALLLAAAGLSAGAAGQSRALRIGAPPLSFVGTGPGAAGPAPAQPVHKAIHAAPLRFVGRGPTAGTHR
jgi:hypothetical protein